MSTNQAHAIEKTETSPLQGPTEQRDTIRQSYMPAVDVVETKDAYQLIADVPGAAAETVELSFEKDQLTVHAPVADTTPEEGCRPLVREYGVGDYRRTFRVGEGIDTTRISASLDAGVLTVTLPKADAVKPRRIEVQPG